MPDGQKLSRQECKGATTPGNRSRGATFPVTTRKAMESRNLHRETLGQIIIEADRELFRRNRHDLKRTQENPPADRPEPVPQSASESYVTAAATPAPSPVARRTSSRHIKRPARFADYVC